MFLFINTTHIVSINKKVKYIDYTHKIFAAFCDKVSTWK